MNTPLTDAKQIGSKHYMLNELVVTADFARKLERDRARLIEYVRKVGQKSDSSIVGDEISDIFNSLEADK